MDEYKIGQVFTGIYPPEAAAWCNQRGDCYIEELPQSRDGRRRFRIVAVPEPTEEEIAEQVRAKRDSLIAKTDFLVMPDYPLTDEEREAVQTYRQALRDIPQQEGFPTEVLWPEVEWPEVTTVSEKVTEALSV